MVLEFDVTTVSLMLGSSAIETVKNVEYFECPRGGYFHNLFYSTFSAETMKGEKMSEWMAVCVKVPHMVTGTELAAS